MISSLFVFIVPMAALAMNRALKDIYQRERPSINMNVEGAGFSFPSGHASGSLVYYGLFIYFIVKSRWKRSVKWLLISVFLMTILLIGVSRIYFRVHYPSDVLGGYAFGLAFLLASILIFERFEAKQRKRV